MYNRTMTCTLATRSLWLCLAATLLVSGCRAREVGKDLRLVDVTTGWYDAGIVDGGENKLVPSVSLKIQNVSGEPIRNVQMNAIFRRGDETQIWGEHFGYAVDRNGLDAGATGKAVVFRSERGYTGPESRAQMLQHKDFVDARVQVFGKHGSRTWVKMGEFPVERKLLTD